MANLRPAGDGDMRLGGLEKGAFPYSYLRMISKVVNRGKSSGPSLDSVRRWAVKRFWNVFRHARRTRGSASAWGVCGMLRASGGLFRSKEGPLCYPLSMEFSN